MSRSNGLGLGLRRRVMAALAAAPVAAAEEPAPTFTPTLDRSFLLRDPSISPLLVEIDARLPATPSEARPRLLDAIPFDLFALIAAHRPPHLPNLAAWLPTVPDASTQVGMTGAAGETVMLEASAFVQRVASWWLVHGPRPLAQARVLDYGIGWARVARLFYKMTPVENLHGVDAWPMSLEMARSAGFRGELALIDSRPERLPFEGAFDLVYAFSIFTHLSERTAREAVVAIRRSLAPDGVLVLTVRPAEIWRLMQMEAERLPDHEARGFSFSPLDVPEVDGDVPFGDASISLDYIARAWPEFRVQYVDVNVADPYQLMIFLRPV